MKKQASPVVTILCIFAILICLVGCNVQTSAAEMPRQIETTQLITTISEANIPSDEEIPAPIAKYTTLAEEQIHSSEQASALVAQQEAYVEALTNYLMNDDNIGLNVNNPKVKQVVEEIAAAQERIGYYTAVGDVRRKEEIAAEEEARMEERRNEYASATYIWEFFKKQGYSDQAVAGILGNLMAEVGGQTLDIQYWLSNSTYYGMCQWNKGYFPGVVGADLEGQCNFLLQTIEETFNDWGHLGGYNYSEFIAIQDEKAAALAFAKTYERCGSGSYSVRQSNATKAYNYFVD